MEQQSTALHCCNCTAMVDNALMNLSQEARELYLPQEIPILDSPPSALVFLRDYVSPNRPVIIKNCLKTWSACSSWTPDYLRECLGDTLVTVTSTPNGYADAPVGDRFVLPEEKFMLFKEFLTIWEENDKTNGVHYIQKQNSNFTDEFSVLVKDADCHVSWASEAFGGRPDAVNFWMGNSDSVTSMHKDHYENIYAVVSGCKTFILHPPTDLCFIPYKSYKLAQYKENVLTGKFDIIDLLEEAGSEEEDEHAHLENKGTEDIVKNDTKSNQNSFTSHVNECNENRTRSLAHKTISWISIDPLGCGDSLHDKQYQKCKKFIAKVEAGDVLYLPSLWFHHVTQTDKTIAVNFWYDMQFDIKYNYFKFAEEINSITAVS
eukprot:gene5279-5946_t